MVLFAALGPLRSNADASEPSSLQAPGNQLEPRRIVVDDFLEAAEGISFWRQMEGLAWLNENEVVYARNDAETLRGIIEIADTRTGERRQLAMGSSPRPSPSGDLIAFAASDDQGIVQLWLVDPANGVPRQLTRFSNSIDAGYGGGAAYHYYNWSPDSRSIVVALSTKRTGFEGQHQYTDSEASTAEVHGMGAPPQEQEAEIRLLDIETATDRLLLKEPIGEVRDLSFLPDRRRLVYNWASNYLDLDLRPGQGGTVRLLDTTTGKVRTLVENPGQGPTARASPDGTQIAIRYNTLEMPFLNRHCVMLVNPDTGGGDCVPEMADAASISLGWHPRSGLYARVRPDSGFDEHVEIVDETGRRKVIHGLRDVREFSISADSSSLAWFEDQGDSRHLNVAALSNDGGEISEIRNLLSARKSGGGKGNDRFLRGERRRISWTAPDGVPGSGLLVLPVDYRKGQRYPLLVLIHGGPSSRAEHVTIPPMPSSLIFDYWAGKGYVVLSANYRADGNAGWNALVASRNRKTVFADGMTDVLAGVDEVAKLGIVDEERMGLLGHSYGGTQINYIITHTNRFKVAVSSEGTADRQMSWGYAAAANPYDEWRYGGPPWEQQEAYDRESPFRAVKGVQTPTLFIAGEYGLPGREYAFMYAAWRRQGIPAAYVLYRGEGHGWLRPANQRDAAERITHWIDTYIGGD